MKFWNKFQFSRIREPPRLADLLIFFGQVPFHCFRLKVPWTGFLKCYLAWRQGVEQLLYTKWLEKKPGLNILAGWAVCWNSWWGEYLKYQKLQNHHIPMPIKKLQVSFWAAKNVGFGWYLLSKLARVLKSLVHNVIGHIAVAIVSGEISATKILPNF